MGEVDVLPNGFGVLFTGNYHYIGHFKDGNFDGVGLIYHIRTGKGTYGVFKNNKMILGDVLPVKYTSANDKIAFCRV